MTINAGNPMLSPPLELAALTRAKAEQAPDPKGTPL
jgi:hypothetical protein